MCSNAWSLTFLSINLIYITQASQESHIFDTNAYLNIENIYVTDPETCVSLALYPLI